MAGACSTCSALYKPLRKGMCSRCYARARRPLTIERKRETQRAWQAKNPERVKEKNQAWAKKRTAEGFWRRLDAKRLADPVERKKRNARDRMHGLISRRWISEQAGKNFHHTDYDLPLVGAWVTASEHRYIHLGQLECPQTVDFSAYVKARQRFSRAKAPLTKSFWLAQVNSEASKLGGLVVWVGR